MPPIKDNKILFNIKKNTMNNVKILLLVLFSTLLLINPIFSQGLCSEALQFNFSQNGDDVEVELQNWWNSNSLCTVVYIFSIERISYLDSAPNTPVITRIDSHTADDGGSIFYAFNDNDLSPGTHRYKAIILTDDCTQYILDSGEFTVGAISYDMVWTDIIGASQSDTRLTRNVNTGGNCTSGAASVNTIPSGEDGWVEMTVTEDWSTRFFGLSNVNHPNDACRWTISHSIYLDNRILKIYEGGYIDDFMGFTVGDVIRVERIGAVIHYKKNGVTFYISEKPSYGSLMADVTITHRNGVIGDSRCSHPD